MNARTRKNKTRKSSRRLQPQREAGDTWATKLTVGVQSFLPRRVVGVFKQEMFGYYNTPTAQPNGSMSIQAGSFFQPFNQVGNPIGGTGAGKSNITINSGYNVSSDPLGYSEVQALYQYYKVRRAMLLVRALSVSDVFNMQLCPSTQQASAFTPTTFAANPYGKSMLCGPSQRPNVLKLTMDSPTILGYSQQQYAGLTPTLMSASPSAPLQWFFNFTWQNTTGGNSPTANIYFEFELYQEVEISELEEFSA